MFDRAGTLTFSTRRDAAPPCCFSVEIWHLITFYKSAVYRGHGPWCRHSSWHSALSCPRFSHRSRGDSHLAMTCEQPIDAWEQRRARVRAAPDAWPRLRARGAAGRSRHAAWATGLSASGRSRDGPRTGGSCPRPHPYPGRPAAPPGCSAHRHAGQCGRPGPRRTAATSWRRRPSARLGGPCGDGGCCAAADSR